MIIGVTGDTHNNLKNIKKICSIFKENRADLVFHTGDISLPKSLFAFKDLNCPIKVVLGNNDVEEKTGLLEISKQFACEIFEEPYSTILLGKKICILHHPDLISDEMTINNEFILHGHTHRYRLDKINGCTIFNPGECAGMMEMKNKVGLINLEKNQIKTISF
ncbi:MAG: phosphodiesterase [Pseudomonadota bacterium]|mgnify:FL=1|nr:MAG: phosphodiesterase [Pseudomonadota bacterium]